MIKSLWLGPLLLLWRQQGPLKLIGEDFEVCLHLNSCSEGSCVQNCDMGDHLLHLKDKDLWKIFLTEINPTPESAL